MNQNHYIPILPVGADDPRLKLPGLANGRSYRFHAMVKPSGSQCNLDCAYCYYLHKEELLQQPRKARMSDALLEQHIRQYIEVHNGSEVIFSWQGGEPTLMGLEFFRRVVELQARYKKPGQTVENDLQTNGILLDAAWCAFLKQNNFLVGLSIDGPASLHDEYRCNKGGTKSFDRVMAAVDLLHHYKIPFSALCVVNRKNAKRPIDVYRFMRDRVLPRMIQFIPCVAPADFRTVAPGYWDPLGLARLDSAPAKPDDLNSVVTDWSVAPEDWGYFLTRVWDEWLKRDCGQVFVDQFENVISQMVGNGAQRCTSAQICGKALALEHNGDLYSCDHFVYPEYRLGNIMLDHEGDLVFSERQKAFAYQKVDTLSQFCKNCNYLELCWGDCPKYRFIQSPDGEPGLSYLCRGLKQFYARVSASRSELSRQLRKKRLRRSVRSHSSTLSLPSP